MSDPLELDWGEATAEFADAEKNTATHIVAASLAKPEEADRAVRFALARVRWFAKKMPPGGAQEVWFDDRGQEIKAEQRAGIKSRVAPHVAGLMFFAEGGE